MELTGSSKRDFIDLRTRAEFLDLCGDAEGAERLRELSLESALEAEVNCYAYQLLWRGLFDQAIDLLETNVARHPYSWNAWDSLGEAFEIKGNTLRAIDCYEEAMRLTEHEGHKHRLRRHIEALLGPGRAC